MRVNRARRLEILPLEWAVPGTYNYVIPAGAKRITWGLSIAAGGGAASGCKGAAGTIRPGGNGGNSGQADELTNPILCVGDFAPGAILTITVGAAGVGGASVTANSTNGNNGTAGGGSNISLTTAAGGGGRARALCRASRGGIGGLAGVIGTATNTAQFVPSTIQETTHGAEPGATASQNAGTTPTRNVAMRTAITGGPSGGGLNASNTPTNGGNAPINHHNLNSTAGGAGGAGVAPGGNGTDAVADSAVQTLSAPFGLSGGGGASSATGNAGRGGIGRGYGYGGAGGGAATNDVGNSGAGTNGGGGWCGLEIEIER